MSCCNLKVNRIELDGFDSIVIFNPDYCEYTVSSLAHIGVNIQGQDLLEVVLDFIEQMKKIKVIEKN